jgi:DNA-binding NtrC family response regulator
MRETLAVAVFDPDDPTTVENVAEAVREYRSVVIPCSSQSIVLSTLNEQHIDAVVIGFQEPFKESFRVLSQIKVQATQAEVVFLSEFDDETRWVWIEAIQRGAYEFLPKPVDLVDLQRVLQGAVEKWHRVQTKKLPAAKSKSIRAEALERYQDKVMGVGS